MSTAGHGSENARAGSRRRLADVEGLIPCLWAFLGLRIAVSLLSAIAVRLIDLRTSIPTVPGWPADPVTPGWHNLATGLVREDALWFLRIATIGYRPDDGSAAFFPLYPMLTRVVSWLTGGHPVFAALLVSNLAFLGALLVLYRLTARTFSDGVARRTIVYVAIFPTAFFFLAPYAESLFLLLSVAAFWFARDDRWWLAALAGAAAALTRSVGVLIAPALLVMAFDRSRDPARDPGAGPCARRDDVARRAGHGRMRRADRAAPVPLVVAGRPRGPAGAARRAARTGDGTPPSRSRRFGGRRRWRSASTPCAAGTATGSSTASWWV